ncbi:DnaJ-like protein subfamily C member 9 [Larimichthys crocea]|uniref:Uncharacterized protein n=2 Tax=Larimichthys crocea TaxID=215358 RepID=A0ACD3QAG0_LARCR|nr:dnaJ homolog subfamily C member 9 [Larimichthys crocea]KAE8280786.1 DnaJ-like protein subfamily C member 9 [Larimichthys crocea]TMS04252.1 DnaJ-like protein subfamily C member 9 [Larimichthys crocea]
MGLLERCQELFKTSDLYELLGVNKEATEAQIRRSYYKVSLRVHPDRAPEDADATEKFQVLGKLYKVLSDKELRAVYDEQGVVDEEPVLSNDRDWVDHWRRLFPEITVQDIIEFEKTYKGTDEERQDVIRVYMQYEGDMDAIAESVLCFTQEEEPRICGIIQAAIDSGDAPAFPAFSQESAKKKRARRKRAAKEQKEAEEMQKQMGLGQEDSSLVAMLQQRQKSREQNFNSFVSDLEAKYSKKSGKAKRGKK